ncbi:LysM peptidoglycan-binding domain-containing protein [Bradyrhizobium ontarionense]|uniref:LysM peptidoglycan-binding domain-containing protein n=1 Tax=Bradyrhizobium ontarionense TaxID=2898149 RepID=A0ABY3RDY1_9BRAD|nr:LysM peptidoglycan-binding domain-containing protein [Bradyrhizobium sp. A19]UFZ05503.1 LysM peptidoglycan-binding domain-containing protein [Bradyrhizobium sp. A19]
MTIVSGKGLFWAGGAFAALAAAVLLIAFVPGIDLGGSIFKRGQPAASQEEAARPGAGSEQGAADKVGSTQAAAALATAQQQASSLAALLAPVTPLAADSDSPSFDVVSVEPSGETVVAGRAAPGATVELLRNGEPHDRVVADQSGQFSMVPRRLPAGASDLTLRARQPDGREVSSRQSVAVVVEAGKRPPTVALLTPDQPTRVLSKPGASSPQAVAVDAVDIEPNGLLRVSGRARPGATVRLYLNDRLVGSAVAGPDGRLTATIKDAKWSSKDRLRLDEVDAASGTVLARAEVPLNGPEDATTASVATRVAAAGQGTVAAVPRTQLAAAPGADLKDMGTSSARAGAKTFTVSRGDSLWHISRRLLGVGTRYAVIYQANREQIRSPDLIYPGQVFVLPVKR